MQVNLSNKTLHFRHPMRVKGEEKSTHHYVGVMISDDKGTRIGMGECSPVPSLSSDYDAYTRMSDVAKLINEALTADDYAEFLRPYPALLFALESAMYDYQQSPMLYDTPFTRSEVGLPLVGALSATGYEEMFSEAKRMIVSGFRCLKITLGTTEWDDVVRLLEKLRSRFTPDTLRLRIDANASFTLDEAATKLEQLSHYGIHSVEQPIRRYEWKAMAQLCKDSPVPIALGEELTGVNSLAEKRALLDTIRPQMIAVKPMLHGGMAGSIEWVSEAQKRGIGSWLGGICEGSIAIRNLAMLASRIYDAKTAEAQDFPPLSLYTDNIEMDVLLRAGRLWRYEVED